MKTTLELPDELMRAVKIRAVNEGRRIKDVMAELIRRGLSEEPEPAGSAMTQVRVPLIECAHSAGPHDEMTPERVADILAHDDAAAAS